MNIIINLHQQQNHQDAVDAIFAIIPKEGKFLLVAKTKVKTNINKNINIKINIDTKPTSTTT